MMEGVGQTGETSSAGLQLCCKSESLGEPLKVSMPRPTNQSSSAACGHHVSFNNSPSDFNVHPCLRTSVLDGDDGTGKSLRERKSPVALGTEEQRGKSRNVTEEVEWMQGPQPNCCPPRTSECELIYKQGLEDVNK